MQFTPKSLTRTSQRQVGAASTFLLVLVAFLIGILCAYFIFKRPATGAGATTSSSGRSSGLAASSKAVLLNLNAPVQIRMYCLLDNSVSDDIRAYAQRVRSLLTQYEQAAGGKIQVRQFTSIENESESQEAATDGIRAFNRDKGRASYFGVAIAQNTQKQTIPYLDPAWEPALEADITRAIQSLNSRPVTQPTVSPPPLDPVAEKNVREILPDLEKLTLEEANRRLKQTALEDFAKLVSEMAPALKAAEQRVTDSKTPEEQAAARDALTSLRSQQTERIKELAAKSQSQTEALTHLKAAQN